MPLLSTEAMNESLDNDYADNDHQLVLFFDDPSFEDDPTDVELAVTGGYARVTVEPGDWAAAADGSKTATVQMAATTAEWPEAARYFGLWDVVEEFWRDYAALGSPLEVTGVGDGPVLLIEVFYDDAVTIATGEG